MGGVRRKPGQEQVTPGDLPQASRCVLSEAPSNPDAIPLIREDLQVGRRSIETDHVRVRTVVDEVPVWRSEQVERGELDVERVAVNRAVDAAPAPYEQDGVLVVPVVEERLVVEKRLFVVEELRIRRRAVSEAVPIVETLRRQRAVVERDVPPATGGTHD